MAKLIGLTIKVASNFGRDQGQLADMPLISQALRDKWISPRDRVDDARLRLFCIPHAGSGATVYQSWRRDMPGFVELCPVKLPGRETRIAESSFSSMRLLVQEMTDVLASDCEMPYAIFGHSMGALIAYEFAQNLRRKGLAQPVCLFLSGRVAAHLELPTKPLHDLPRASFLQELERRYGGLPSAILKDEEMLNFYLPILRADLGLIEKYRYEEKSPLGCPMFVSAGTEDTSVWAGGLEEWRRHTIGHFEVSRYQGGHFYLSGESREAVIKAVIDKMVLIDKAIHG